MSTSININSTQISALLQLYPMAIPGAVENLQPPGAYHLGIPESIHSPSTKLFMVIDPVTLFSTPSEAGNSVRLWVNGQATSVIKPIKPGEENNRIFMELLWGVMKDGLNTLYYEVTRVSGNKDQSTPILNVLFNNPVSGITVSHPASIGPGQPATFTLTRDYPREYDVMTLTVGTWSKTIPYVHPANPVTYTLTTLDLQQIGDGTRSVSATNEDQLSNLRVSPTTSIVITANTLVLPPPSVTGQTGNNFNPTLQNVEGVVPAGTLLPSDKIHFVWEGAISAPGASFTSPQRLVSAGLKFVVPRSVLAYSLGNGIKVSYVIERNGVTTSSKVLPLNILPLPATALVPPKIVEADANNVLDVIALGAKNATIHALLWTLIADGMPCWLSLEGKKADGTAHNLVLWNGLLARVNPTWVSQGFWPQALVNSYLKQLGDGTSLIIKFAVSMDMSNVRATAVEFPDRAYMIKAVALVVPTIGNVNEDTATGKPVAGAGFTTATTLVIRGKLSPGQQGELYDGSGASAKPLGKMTANPAGDYSITITVAQGAHRFYIQSLYHPGTVYSNVWTLTVVANVNAIIDWIKENSATGALVPKGGSTTATTLVISGKASAGHTLQLLDHAAFKATIPVDVKGVYTYTLTGQAPGEHSYTVKANYGSGVESSAWALRIILFSPLYDLTDFNDLSMRGWIKGPAGRELQFWPTQDRPGYHLFNNTSGSGSHAGTVLSKEFEVFSGRTYEFRVTAKKVNPGTPNDALLVLYIGNSASSTFRISSNPFQDYSFRAAALTTGKIAFQIVNLQSAMDGNDYDIDSLLVRSL
ncbi:MULTISPECIES: hypothetical protein [Pseudomonas]|uniref:hypothetical protein n=1 Tax=Pseudomonas TaxID=286 RepID=UPI0006423E37|nr:MULTISPECIES: hypothetical protein [Pseudomonas]QXE09886.1 hypothetical protein GTQ41_12630 [Pseudomonas sp. AN-B15]